MSFIAESGKKLPLEGEAGKKLPSAGVWGAVKCLGQSFAAGPHGVVLLVFVLIFCLYPEILLGTHSLFYRDFGLFGAPVAAFHRQAFWEGQLPLWNPLNNCGLPFAAQWNTLVFYPFSLLYLLLPFPWSLNLFSVGHIVLGACCMFLLAKDWLGAKHPLAASVAALAFAWNGLTLHSLMWPNNLAALGWMPLVVLHLKHGSLKGGRALFAGALIGGVQMLTGAPEIILFTWLLGLAYALMARGSNAFSLFGVRFASMAALVLGVAAVQLLPFAGLVEASHRDRHLAGGDAWAMPAWGLANFFVPLFRCTPSYLGVFSQTEQQWTSSYYMGGGMVVLVMLALWKVRSWRVRLMGCCLLLAFWFAMGREGGLYDLVLRVLPITGFARYPVKLVVVTATLMSLLAAEGMAWVLEEDQKRSHPAIVWSSFMFLVITALILFVAFRFPFPEDIWSTTWRSGLSRAMWLGLFAALLLLLKVVKKREHQFGIALLLLICMGLDVASHAPRQNPVVTIETVSPADGNAAPVTLKPRVMLSGRFKSFIGSAATADPYETWRGYRRALFSNANILDSQPKADGFFSLYLNEESAVRNYLEARPDFETLPLLDFMGIEKVPHSRVLFSWVTRTNHLPLVTGGQLPVFAAPEQAFQRIMSRAFEPALEVILPPLAREAADEIYDRKPIFSDLEAGEQGLTFHAKAKHPAWVVLAQSYYEPWRLLVDGQRTKIWKANYAFQSFKLPSGEHRVELTYMDSKLYWGMAISLCSLGLCITGAGWKLPTLVGSRPPQARGQA
jgi:hypothetical protein